MREISKLVVVGAFAALALGAAPASANPLGVDFTSGLTSPTCNGPIFCSPSYNAGYVFTVNSQPVSVNALGDFDGAPDANNGGAVTGSLSNLQQNQIVGLWDSSGNLLAYAFIGSGSTQIGLWAFSSSMFDKNGNAITSVALTPGATYVVGAQGGYTYFAGMTPIDVDSYITYVQDAETGPGVTGNTPADLVEPTTSLGLGTSDAGFFGGNVELVPEPMSLTLFGAGLFGLALARRRKRG